jgi:hypothetical protein
MTSKTITQMQRMATADCPAHTAERQTSLIAKTSLLEPAHRPTLVTAPPPLLQAKLSINRPGDRYEREADQVTEQVLRMPEPGVQRQTQPEDDENERLQLKPLATQLTPLLQRQLAREDDEDEDEIVPAKATPGQAPRVTPALANQIAALRGGGAPLPAGVQGRTEHVGEDAV